MRKALLMSVAALGLATGGALAQTAPTAAPAQPGAVQPGPTTPPETIAPPVDTMSSGRGHAMRAGHEPGVGDSEPSSTRASNINGGHSEIAPRLPTPPGGDNAGVRTYLRDAQSALSRHRTGEAQEALERAQTRLLDRSVAQGDTNVPAQDPMVQTLEQARQALARNDVKGAQRLINDAMTRTASTDGDMSGMSDRGMPSMSGRDAMGRGMTGSGQGLNGGAAASGRMSGPDGVPMSTTGSGRVPARTGAAPDSVNPTGGATSQY